MAIEETLRFRVESDTSGLRSGIVNMASDVGNSIQSTVGFAGQAMSGVGATASTGFDVMQSSIQGSYGAMQYYGMGAMQGAANSLQQAAQHRMMVHNMIMSQTIDPMAQAVGQQYSKSRDFSDAASAIAFGGAAALTTAVGWGLASSIAPSPGKLWAAGKAMGGAKGYIMGGLGAGAAMMLPYMAVDAAVGMATDDVTQNRQIANAIGGMSSMYVNPLYKGVGSQFSSYDQRDMASGLMFSARNIDRQAILDHRPTLGIEGITQILKGSEDLFRDHTLSPDQFRKKFTEKVNMVREFAEAFNKTIEESVEITKALSGRHGIAPGSDPRQIAMSVGLSANAAGLTTTGMIGVAQAGVSSYAAAGIARNPLASMSGAIQNVSNVHALENMGIANRMDLRAVGGATALGQSMTQMQAGLMQGGIGNFLAALQMQGGNELVQQVASGKVGLGEMLSQAAGVAGGGVNKLSDFFANSDVLKSKINPIQQLGFMGSMAVNTLEQMGMNVNTSNVATVFQSTFGMNNIMARTLAQQMANAPEMYGAQMNAASNTILEQAKQREGAVRASSMLDVFGMRELKAGWVGFRQDFTDRVSKPVGNWFTQIGENIEDWKEGVLGLSSYNMSSQDFENFYRKENPVYNKMVSPKILDRAWKLRASQTADYVSRQIGIFSDGVGKIKDNAPEWVKTAYSGIKEMRERESGSEAAPMTIAEGLINGVLGLDQYRDEIIAGSRVERNLITDFTAGYRGFQDVISKNQGFFNNAGVVAAMRKIRYSSMRKKRSAEELFNEIEKETEGMMPTADREERIKIAGALAAEHGIELSKETTASWDATMVKAAQREVGANKKELAWRLGGSRGFNLFTSKAEYAGEYLLGGKAANALGNMGVDAQKDSARIIILSNKKRNNQISKNEETELSTLRVNMKNRMNEANISGEARTGLLSLTEVGGLDGTRLAEMEKKGVMNKLEEILPGLAGAEDMKATRGLMSHFTTKVGIDIEIDKKGEEFKGLQIAISTISGGQKLFDRAMKEVQLVSEGNIEERIDTLSKTLSGKKGADFIDILKRRGGINMKRVGELFEGIREFSGKDDVDAISWVSKETHGEPIRKFNLEGRLAKAKQEAEGKEDYLKRVNKINKDFFTLLHGGDAVKAKEINKIAARFAPGTSAKIIKNIALSKQGDYQYLKKVTFGEYLTKSGSQKIGKVTEGGTTPGQFAATTRSQIDMMKQHIATLDQLQKTLSIVASKIKPG